VSGLHPPSAPGNDRGLLLGDGLFETIRVYRGRPFRLDRHLARLRHGAGVVGIRVPRDLEDRIGVALAELDGSGGFLRITLTRGTGRGLRPSPGAEPRVYLAVGPQTPGGASAEEGLRAVIRGRLDERSLVAGLKSLGFLERIQALRLAEAAGAEEALLRNGSDQLVEASASNLLAVRDGTLIAPGPESGALAGITREVLLEAAVSRGWRVEERGLREEELSLVSEVLLSSSLREVVPVVAVEGRRVGHGRPGPFFRALSLAFREVVRSETAG